VQDSAEQALATCARIGSDCGLYQEGKGKFDFKPTAAKASDTMATN
jgi:hypothetical protein